MIVQATATTASLTAYTCGMSQQHRDNMAGHMVVGYVLGLQAAFTDTHDGAMRQASHLIRK